ncbi:UDP-N-acetylenolpyruvoylglucosamine reductase [Aliidiomarina iranensis]|uniref:UDP-N-acetylenolpyruvoylglucosamine reductase n=1 Tax=Aliidiomarina iranensis TaxID=1434071 RepID=A0A432VTX9_9GAMM|nr:UDP-N-acetylmuramate dehydrogenase [Aliidiomarina iranensis]RUO19935.1 UDP-N-acetylenolpyruvoylglucosamine reductase [Aliidiomarina iranensis]
MTSLRPYHSFALPASAESMLYVDSEAQLENIIWRDDMWILGAGSNTIFVDDYAGVVLVNQLKGIQIDDIDDGWLIEVAAGENWHALVVHLIELGIPGLENLALIPGSVGAAPVQNIGAYGVEVSKYIGSVRVYDLKAHKAYTLSNAECEFAYRDSLFKQPCNAHLLITSVQFKLPKNWQPTLTYPDLNSLPPYIDAKTIMAHVISVRNAKLPDPQRIPNAGSFFKNPVVAKAHYDRLIERFPNLPAYVVDENQVKLAAGWLIDNAGLKSMKIGGAEVHQRQALVLVNKGNATGEDLLSLARAIQARVEAEYGVKLEPEVRLLGKHGLLGEL